MQTTVGTKVEHLFFLLESLSKGETLYAQDTRLQERLQVNQRTLYRYLDEIHERYAHIVNTKKEFVESLGRRLTVFKIYDVRNEVSKVLKFFMENNSDDLRWLLQLVHENDPTLLYEADTKDTLKNCIRSDQEVFLFVGTPFEQFKRNENKLFKIATTAVKHHDYRTIHYCYHNEESLKDVKCLKLIFMQNNWYLAVEEAQKKVRFLRFCFIKSIDYSRKNSFQRRVLDKYSDFFHQVQNPMTLYAAVQQTAHLRASKTIAIYFRASMKPFFPSQKFLQSNDDGSIDFSLSFTQAIEILPFIKQWQPHITILSPQTLKDELIDDLRCSLEHHCR